MKININEIRKVPWQHLVTRKESLLFHSVVIDGDNFFRKTSGIPWAMRWRIESDNGKIFHNIHELEKLNDLYQRGGVPVLRQFSRALLAQVGKLDKLARQIEKVDCFKLNKKRLVNLLKKYFQTARMATQYLVPMPVADKAISQMILEKLPDASRQQKQKWLSILTYPTKENEHTREERAFYQLAGKFKANKKNLDKLVSNHLKLFDWIGARGWWFQRAWSMQDLKKRLDFFTKHNNPSDELKHLDSMRCRQRQDTKKLIKQLKIKSSSELYKLILIAREYAFLRTWRTDIIYRSGYRVRFMFYEIARRTGFPIEDIPYLTYRDIIGMAIAGQPIGLEEIQKRRQRFVNVRQNGKYILVTEKSLYKQLNNIIQKKVLLTKAIKGNVAFTGQARGTVKVVSHTEDVNKVNRGDILVAVMTFPHFMPAMEKAAAFVTDEGGILCHAAIVSREMRKPCIIATKNATRVFKDGDKVLVDAKKGIVKKI